MLRMTCSCVLALCLSALLWNKASAAEISVRDAATGAPLAATLEYRDGASTHSIGLAEGTRLAELPAQVTTARVLAAGHRELSFQLGRASGEITLLLEPEQEPAAYAALAQRVQDHPAARWLQGYVRRAHDGAAIAGALVSSEGRGTRSDARGYFELELPAIHEEDLSRSSLNVDAGPAGVEHRDGLLRTAGVQRLLIALTADQTRVTRSEIGALDRGVRAVGSDNGQLAPLARLQTPIGPLLAPGLAPPGSIRVGFADAACTQSCCTGSCTNTCVLPLETYVRRGLDSEWIASWNTQSLRAGSIAYRSYGAWRVANPIRANFDICSSACCQVNDGGTSTSTDNAIARTPGILLTRSGNTAASAEYSAENNSWDNPNDGLSCSNSDLSCGDGFAGSPSNGWPCLADSVGAGHGCFGHGRGMSQWGTQRWAIDASARRWPWIVDHYFNDNGAGSGQRTAVMTSPLTLANLAAQPAAAAPGTLIQLSADADNTAGASHSHLLIGASLYRSGVGYIDDAAHDSALVLATGTQAITRAFEIAPGTPAGSYDLLVSLYLDVDENGAITSADLPLALATRTAALQLIDDRIFADGFDVTP